MPTRPQEQTTLKNPQTPSTPLKETLASMGIRIYPDHMSLKHKLLWEEYIRQVIFGGILVAVCLVSIIQVGYVSLVVDNTAIKTVFVIATIFVSTSTVMIAEVLWQNLRATRWDTHPICSPMSWRCDTNEISHLPARIYLKIPARFYVEELEIDKLLFVAQDREYYCIGHWYE